MLIIVNERDFDARIKRVSFQKELINLNLGTPSQTRLDGSELFSAISAIVDVFRSINHAQTLLEGNAFIIVKFLWLNERLK